jgi:hypothetical protein
MFGLSDKSISTDAAISAFQTKIAAQEDIIYGVALFFECLNYMHAGQGAIMETHRKQFRNIIQKGTEMIQHASRLLDEVRQDPKKVKGLQQFAFTPCQDHPKPAEMTRRAEILVQTYRRVFPDRPRSQEFSNEEIAVLIEEASEALSQSTNVTPAPSHPQSGPLP